MLEELDKINWSQLHYSHGGTADDVPLLIKALLSQDECERDIAFQKLLAGVWHYGSIWEVTPYEVPFLWELLKSPETPNKLFVANLLTVIAKEEHTYHHVMKDERKLEEWKIILAEQGKSLDEEVEKAKRYYKEVHSEIAKEFHFLYPYLFCEEPVIRDYVAKAFGNYPEFKSETLPLLEKALLTETDEFAKETIENSIKILSEAK